MSLKTVAAIIVASLVAGVVLGSMGIAGASPDLQPPVAAAPAACVGDCGSCGMAAEAAANCGDCANAGVAGGCPKAATGSAQGACNSGGCPQ